MLPECCLPRQHEETRKREMARLHVAALPFSFCRRRRGRFRIGHGLAAADGTSGLWSYTPVVGSPEAASPGKVLASGGGPCYNTRITLGRRFSSEVVRFSILACRVNTADSLNPYSNRQQY